MAVRVCKRGNIVRAYLYAGVFYNNKTVSKKIRR